MRQTNLEIFKSRVPKAFGGSRLKSHAKVKRPLATKQPLHLVVKSSYATGARSMLRKRNASRIEAIIRSQARLKGLRVYHFVNVGNHLHLVLRVDHRSLQTGRRAYRAFIRAVTGLIARHVLGAERGAAQGAKFWQARPFTRIVTWGRDYLGLSGYMLKNQLEAIGFVKSSLATETG